MANLRDTVKDYQEELRDGIAWVAFWKTGRSWNAEYFHLEMGDILYPEDRSRMEEIKQADPAAVVVNGYYSGYLGEDRNLDELTAGVRRHYENGYSNIGEFIEAHDDRLPPELIEEARAAAHAAGLPFSEKAYRGGEEPDPYLFDGSMSMEDYELMHRMIEKERSERMEETILSGYLSNLGKYTEGRPAGEWVSFPTTAEHLKEVFDRIGIDGKNYGELHITEYQSSIPGLAGKLTELESLDELNYLGELLKMQFDDDREKFAAAITYGDHTRDLQDIINLAQNLDCYWIYPSVKTEEDYGHYLIEELDELELPEEAKNYFLYEEYGRDAAINDGGRFTEQGYIYNNRNTFTQWYDGRDVPEEYRVTPQPPVQEKEQADLDAAAAIPTTATEQPPVLPIILSSEKPANKMKEITDRLEQGILGIYESDRYADYLRTMSKFHDYSLNNTILIAMQGGNLVKGYKQWEKEFDRHVKPGEKAIKIIAPAPFIMLITDGSVRIMSYGSELTRGTSVYDFTVMGNDQIVEKYLSNEQIRPYVSNLNRMEIGNIKSTASDGISSPVDWSKFRKQIVQHLPQDVVDPATQEDGMYSFGSDQPAALNLLGLIDTGSSSPYLLPVSSYNRLLDAAGEEQISLGNNEVVYYLNPDFLGNAQDETVTLLNQIAADAQANNEASLSINERPFYLVPSVPMKGLTADENIKIITALIVSDEIYSEFVNSDTCMVYWNFCIPNELVETKGLMLPIMEARDLLKPSGLYYESYLNNFGRQLFYVISGSYTTLYMGFMFLIIACALLALQFLTQMKTTKSRYLTLSILGARREQIKRSINQQVLWYFLLPLILACISGAVGIYAMQLYLYSGAAHLEQSYPLLIAMAVIVVLVMVIYGVAVARTANREIGKLNYKPNS